MSGIDKHRETFREEAHEHLSDLEAALLELEERPEDGELIGRAFRALHTIKGSGAMFGFDRLSAFTHEIESVFDCVRNGEIPVTKALIDLTLYARDHIRGLLGPAGEDEGADGGSIIESFKKLMPPVASPGPKEACTQSVQSSPAGDGEEKTCRINFRPGPDLFRKGIDPLMLFAELRAIGNCTVLAYTDDIPALDEIDPESCYTSWDILLTTGRGMDEIKDVFIFIGDDSKLEITAIERSNLDDEFGKRKIGEILIERGFVTRADLDKVLGAQKRLGEMLIEAKVVDPRKVEAALAEQQHFKEIREAGNSERSERPQDAGQNIRVSSEKLDRLVDLVGELVTVQSRLTQTAASGHDPLLVLIAEEVERLTAELRDNTMSIRMLPLGTIFSKFKRLVRDLSGELGKEVELTMEGADTELDKNVIDRMNDPLVHLLRNSMDHGIEPPEVRESAGKKRRGEIHLSALHSGANVLIEIKDDGAGLDTEAILAKAVEKGLIEPGTALSEKKTQSLIFSPGFSTASEITSVSGRGVGMDVVKRSIDALRGSIEVSSCKGRGTVITLKLPLTLAIIDGLLVKVGEEFFVIPLSLVEECVELTAEDIKKAHGRHISNLRGEIIPYISLRERFQINGGKPDIELIVVTRVEGSKIGFVVDHVIGGHQTVIKNLGRMYRDAEGVSGATILGDGTLALILDISRLAQSAEQEEVKAC